MKIGVISLNIFILLSLIVAGCGPNTSALATQTAASWTATPLPTDTPIPTDTLVPYNLNLRILDAEGSPIAGVLTSIADLEQFSDNQGWVTFTNLPNASITITFNAPGYLPLEVTKDIQRGENEMSITLQPDPFGLLPKNACAPGEKLLYLEDFQDGQAQGWNVFEMQLPNWSLESAPDQEKNLVMAARQGAGWAQLGDENLYAFDNSVWRLRFMYVGNGASHLNWRFNPQGGDRRYIIGLALGDLHLRRFDSGNDVKIGNAGSPSEGWHLLEIGFYQGTVTVYLDGQEGITWTDPNPLAPGTIGIEPYPQGDAVFYYDNLSVCELSAPFAPIPRAETGINLVLGLTDAGGNPVQGATVSIEELGNMPEAMAKSNLNGQISWTNLPGETAHIIVNAPGYFPLEEVLVLQKGENQASFTLESDPFGLTLNKACRPEENMVYIDDFQDGIAQEWDVIELQTPGWSVEADAEQPENLVIAARQNAQNAWFGGADKYDFTQVVWRFRFNYHGKGYSHINFRWSPPHELDARYILYLARGVARLDRLIAGNHITIRNIGSPQGDQWHLLEIGFFDGVLYIYLDGQLSAEWRDAQPWEGGTMNLEPYPSENSVFYYDDFSICELNGPLQSILAETAP